MVYTFNSTRLAFDVVLLWADSSRCRTNQSMECAIRIAVSPASFIPPAREPTSIRVVKGWHEGPPTTTMFAHSSYQCWRGLYIRGHPASRPESPPTRPTSLVDGVSNLFKWTITCTGSFLPWCDTFVPPSWRGNAEPTMFWWSSRLTLRLPHLPRIP